jgi:16S rRNA (cytosine1402-N4)-methyltransferase
MEYHKPVMLHECLELLQLKPDGIYVDVTFGGGGHSKAILKQLENGKLFGFDQDKDAVNNIPKDENFTLIEANFRHLQRNLRVHGVREVDGILADLGISSHQIDAPERGFSLRFDAALDMRMNADKPFSAKNVLNEYDQDKLHYVLKEYGEFPKSWYMASAIIRFRDSAPIETTADLKAALKDFEPKAKPAQFWARVFQAIRIEVNDEMGALLEMLEQAKEVLKPGGRLVVMSYHSLEDRPVKNFMRTGNFEGTPEKDFYGNLIRPMEPVNRKPIVAGLEEIQDNPRARSAKLRAAEKNPAL